MAGERPSAEKASDFVRVSCAIIERDGRVLIAKRRQGMSNAGRWEFPGGTIEAQETPEAALMREILEEFGARAQVLDLVGSNRHDYPKATVELMAYRVKLLTEDLSLKEHDEIRWVRREDLGSYDLTEADRPIAKLLV